MTAEPHDWRLTTTVYTAASAISGAPPSEAHRRTGEAITSVAHAVERLRRGEIDAGQLWVRVGEATQLLDVLHAALPERVHEQARDALAAVEAWLTENYPDSPS